MPQPNVNENEKKDSTPAPTKPATEAFYGKSGETKPVETPAPTDDSQTPPASDKPVGDKPAGDTPPVETPPATPKPGEENKDGQKKEDEKPADPAAPKAPDKYELKLPEGSKLKPSAISRIDRIAREQGLTNEAAQQLLIQEHEAVAHYQKELDDNFSQIKAQWKTELENDPVLGGANLKANSELARRGLEANFSKKTIELIDQMEYANQKDFFNDLVKLGKRLSDDKITPAAGQPPQQRKRSEDVFYGNKET